MAIDPERVLGAELAPAAYAWEPDDVVLYHLALGAGDGPLDRRERRYTYGDDLQVLPSFGVLPAQGVARSLGAVPGMDVDLSARLHGEHEIELFAPLPPAGRVHTTGRVAALYDKATAAVVVVETTTTDTDTDGRRLAVNRFTMFLRGAGGFGGERGPTAVVEGPLGPPAATVRRPTRHHQALLYALTGDRNPIHVDPDAAIRAGFERPILHGLCTFGVVLKAAVDAMLDADVARVRGFRARFAGVVFPGETIQTALWPDRRGILVEATVAERNEPVLRGGLLTLA